MCPANGLSQANPDKGPAPNPADQALVKQTRGMGGTVLEFSGQWTIAGLAPADEILRRWGAEITSGATLDLAAVTRLDTAGAWVIHRTRKALRDRGLMAEYTHARDAHLALLARVEAGDQPPPPETAQPHVLVLILAEIGGFMAGAAREFHALLGFLGLTMNVMGRSLVNPRRLRLTPLVYHLEAVGLNAVPIVSLISFLIGMVLAYQGAEQLRQFGAEIFTVELVAISVLREIGILLTAILVAGRSGSAFTAQIGSMKLNEEIDAMRALALDPMEILVLPRILALMIALPMLGFIADIMGLFGGAVMCWTALDITPGLYVQRLDEWVPVTHFWAGIIKAPFFALIIGLVGCFEGMQVEGGAESVGRLTTKSVVESIFMVIVLDAVFSIYFVVIGL